jgi:hypothetical protein
MLKNRITCLRNLSSSRYFSASRISSSVWCDDDLKLEEDDDDDDEDDEEEDEDEEAEGESEEDDEGSPARGVRRGTGSCTLAHSASSGLRM